MTEKTLQTLLRENHYGQIPSLAADRIDSLEEQVRVLSLQAEHWKREFKVCNDAEPLKILHELKAENARLRAALAQSDQPCAYCTLPAEQWSECADGFPGCARGDDAAGCPALADAMQLHMRVAELDAALKPFASGADIIDGLAAGSPSLSPRRDPSEWSEEYFYADLAAARAALKGNKHGD